MTANENPHDESTMNQQQRHQSTNSGHPAPGFLGKLLAFVLSIGLFALAFIFSLAALAVVAVVGVIFAGWLWWKTRALRQQVKEAAATGYRGGNIIEGEVVRTTDAPPRSERQLP
jgi:Flp pilus assembly protein TadB